MARLNWLLLAAGIAVSACHGGSGPPGLGRRLVAGPARNLRPSPDGLALAYLDGCAPPAGLSVPQNVLSCDLEMVSTAGGTPRRVARGVSTLELGFAWAPDGHAMLALASYDLARGSGALVLARTSGETTPLSDDVSFYGFSPDGGKIAFVSRGRLFLAERDRAPAAVPGATDVATFEFSPGPGLDGFELLARRSATAGGGLLGIRGGELTRVVEGSGDYAFSPSGREMAFTARRGPDYDLLLAPVSAPGRSERVGRSVQSFAFAREVRAVAFIAGIAPGRSGDLYVVSAGGGATRLAPRVGDYRWAAGAPRLAWLQDFDPRVRSGTLAAGGPGLAPAVLGKNVTVYDLSRDGRRVAFLEHVTAGTYSVDLKLADLSAGGPPRIETLARGAFGFDFSPDGERLYYRTSCVRRAEACDLYRVPASGPRPGERAERIAEGVKSFEFARGRPERLLVTWSRKDLVALDLGVLDGSKVTVVDRAALPGSAAFLEPDASRLAYIVADPKRAGVYVAELPK